MAAPAPDVAVGQSRLPGAARQEAADAAVRDDILGLLGRADLEVCVEARGVLEAEHQLGRAGTGKLE